MEEEALDWTRLELPERLVSCIDHPGACCCNPHLAGHPLRQRRSWLVGRVRQAKTRPWSSRVPPGRMGRPSLLLASS
jgi:hypothetical protein